MIRATRDLSDASRFLGDEDEPGEFQAVVVLLGIVAAGPALASAVLDSVPGADGVAGGLAHRDRSRNWASFAAEPRPVDGRSSIVGPLTEEEVVKWSRLHQGLGDVTKKVTLPDLTAFQVWAPRVRRFSYSSG